MTTMTRPALSMKQEAILAFIRRYYATHGLPPSIREIMDACYISSTSVVDYNVKALIRQGLLRSHATISYQSRSVLPVRQPGEPCPTCGHEEPS